MAGININLTPQLEDLVRQKVASGLYTSASEVVREALRMMEERDQLKDAKLEQLREAIREGLDSGPATPWDPDEVKRAGRARWAAQKAGSRWRRCPLEEFAASIKAQGVIQPIVVPREWQIGWVAGGAARSRSAVSHWPGALPEAHRRPE